MQERYVPMFTVVGEALVDLVGVPPNYTAHAGGSPYNVAITLGRLGQQVQLVARTGRDVFGRMLEDKARASAVSFERWQVVDEPTTLAVAGLRADGSASYDFYLDSTAGLGWDDGIVDLVPTGGVLHLGSIASWRPPSAGVLQALQRRARDGGATLVSYDPNVRPALIADRDTAGVSIERCVSAAHLVKASDEDVEFLYPSVPMAEVARRWCGLGAELVVVTLGGEGAVAFGADGELARRPGESITVADTVGAGDSFAGGLLAALGAIAPSELGSADLDAALAQAVLVSAMTCERHGADPPTRAELDERRLQARA
jgi:fructokinase